MRPQGRGEFDSLYFDYPQFSAPDPASRKDGRQKVTIVGAGPVGMFAALTLARFGVPSLLIDNKDTLNDGSRAICVQRSSFQALDRAGVVAPFLQKALGWTTGRTLYRGRQILEFHMGHGADDKFQPMYNIQQQFIEQYLWDAIAENDLIDARWCSEAVALHDIPGGVRLTVSDPHGTYTVDSDWLLAADGARSPIRKMRGLRLQGENFEGRYVIADLRMDHDYPTIRRALFDSASNPGKTILIHRQPDNIWRIDYQLPDGQSPEDAIAEPEIRRNVTSILADIGHHGDWELEWWSIYSANTLALEDYRNGQVLFIGDSAHIVPIFGVRGLNNGLADAENAGWKLARIVTGQSAPDLIDSYTPERRGATMDVFANASKSARFMTPPSRGWELVRDAALSLALDHEFAGEFANPRQMEPFTYAEGGAILTPDAPLPKGLVLGTVFEDMQLDQGYLSDLFGPGFNLVLSAKPAPALTQAMQALGITVIAPGDARLAQRYGEGAAVLIRPDGYLCGYWQAPAADRIAADFQSLYGHQEA